MRDRKDDCGLVSVFIDVIGMPMTPISYAGAARRRAYYYR